MSRLYQIAEKRYAFHCPGCECGHEVAVNGGKMENGAAWWQWNGSLENPTFNPSILVRSKEMTAKGRSDYEAWMRNEILCPKKFDCIGTVCHSFVRDGRIMFLTDSTHKLSGQTVEIPEWDDV